MVTGENDRSSANAEINDGELFEHTLFARFLRNFELTLSRATIGAGESILFSVEMLSNRFTLNPRMTVTATQVLAQGMELRPIERLSVAMALLQDGDLPDELFERLRDQIDAAIAIERDQLVENGLDQEISLGEAMRNARESIA